MPFTRVQLLNFRNIRSAELSPSPFLNVICGPNASGKTNFLEALYVLSHGRSFRSSTLEKAVHWGADGFSVFGEYLRKDREGVAATALPLGVGRRSGRREIRVGGESVGSAAELARAVPLVLIHPGSHELLDGGPKHRRSFLNWGVFHVEHSFHGAWTNYQRALRQRNAGLRERATGAALRPWDRELSEWGRQVADRQRAYLNSLQEGARQYSAILLGAKGSTLSLVYRAGWDMDAGDLLPALVASAERDRRIGHTTCGPHRADVVLEYGGTSAAQALSRGQQKLAVIALRLAQAQRLRDLTGRGCLFAVDDIPSELDLVNRRRLLRLLSELGAQVFVTATDASLLDGPLTQSAAMFHVEHGQIHVD